MTYHKTTTRLRLNLWLLDKWQRIRPGDFTYNNWLDEVMEWKYSDVCRLEGCDCPLGEYRVDARFCSSQCRTKAWRLENKEYSREYDKARNKNRRAKLAEYNRRYRQRIKDSG